MNDPFVSRHDQGQQQAVPLMRGESGGELIPYYYYPYSNVGLLPSPSAPPLPSTQLEDYMHLHTTPPPVGFSPSSSTSNSQVISGKYPSSEAEPLVGVQPHPQGTNESITISPHVIIPSVNSATTTTNHSSINTFFPVPSAPLISTSTNPSLLLLHHPNQDSVRGPIERRHRPPRCCFLKPATSCCCCITLRASMIAISIWFITSSIWDLIQLPSLISEAEKPHFPKPIIKKLDWRYANYFTTLGHDLLTSSSRSLGLQHHHHQQDYQSSPHHDPIWELPVFNMIVIIIYILIVLISLVNGLSVLTTINIPCKRSIYGSIIFIVYLLPQAIALLALSIVLVFLTPATFIFPFILSLFLFHCCHVCWSYQLLLKTRGTIDLLDLDE